MLQPIKKQQRKPKRFTWIGLAMLLVFLTVARADTIYLRHGEKVVGKVITEGDSNVVIQSENLGRLEISRDRIEKMEIDAPPPATPKPFVPPPPTSPQVTNSAAAGAGNPQLTPRRKWFWQSTTPADEAAADWIQLKSGEWLRGKLHGMQNRKMDFESDELEDLVFDWKDVHQVIAPRALVSYGDRQDAAGSVRIDKETVTVTGVTGEDETRFPRTELVGLAPGLPRELDYWSGRFNVGLNLRAGNTKQADLVTNLRLERRTPFTHLKFEYVGNYSELNGVESVNNQRASETFDVFLTRRLFVRVPQGEYYHDPFQNINYRITAGGGVGYYLIDEPKMEWLVSGGPAYQLIRFDTVEAGESEARSTPAFVLQSNFEVDLTKRVELELGYSAVMANENSGGVTQHGSTTLEIDLTRSWDLDISLIWDRIGSPQADANGQTPKPDDFRLTLSFGAKF